MKQSYYLFLFFSFLCNSQTTNLGPYCSVGYSVNYNMINSMSFNGTEFNGFGPTGSWTSTLPHRFFDSVVLNSINSGSSFMMSLTFPSVNDIEPRYFAVWIDFNGDQVFSDSELVMNNQSTIETDLPTFGGQQVVATKLIYVPDNAINGTTRMRIIRSQNDSNPFGPYDDTLVLNPCSGFDNGFTMHGYNCTVDFNVNIVNTLSNQSFESSPFLIYPNPASDFLNIQTNYQDYTIDIFDCNGRSLATFSNIQHIDVAHLASGTYFIHFSTFKNGLTIHNVQRFVKDY